jgi:two-component system NtrC family sensor kinase
MAMADDDPIRRALRSALDGSDAGELPADCAYREELEALLTTLHDVRTLATALARGDLRPPEARSRGPLIGSLKGLHANLRHLTWQAQRIAAGDLSHRVDFMGEFSAAFNDMVAQLAERKRLEAQLLQAQKLEAVGQLAAGLAHELNTPAQFVGDNLSFLEGAHGDLVQLLASYRDAVASLPVEHEGVAASMRAREEELDVQYLEERSPKAFRDAQQGLARVASIVAAMKVFARPEQHEVTRANLNESVEATLTISRSRYAEVADVTLALGAIPDVACNVGEINHVLLALVTNAAHAIEDCGRRGLIRVETSTDGAFVRVAVSDTGIGIPREVQGRIFEAFFTTKAVGRGSGQGLAVARAVVERHRGTLTFESEVGRGTTFVLALPLDAR